MTATIAHRNDGFTEEYSVPLQPLPLLPLRRASTSLLLPSLFQLSPARHELLPLSTPPAPSLSLSLSLGRHSNPTPPNPASFFSVC